SISHTHLYITHTSISHTHTSISHTHTSISHTHTHTHNSISHTHTSISHTHTSISHTPLYHTHTHTHTHRPPCAVPPLPTLLCFLPAGNKTYTHATNQVGWPGARGRAREKGGRRLLVNGSLPNQSNHMTNQHQPPFTKHHH